MTLAETQARLAAAIRRLEPLSDPALEVIASGSERLSPLEQIEIYREQFWLRHRDCLRDDFAALVYLLGDERFDDLARSYLAARPPASFTLRDLGAALPTFLRSTAPWSDDLLLSELARVEWAFVDAFDAPDAPPFDPASIAGVAEDRWPGARIRFHPAAQRLALAFPSHDYRLAARSGRAPSRPAARDCQVVVYRGPELLHCLEVEPSAAMLLEELERGTALGLACERAAAASGLARDEFQGRLAGWFSTWTAAGLIRAVEL